MKHLWPWSLGVLLGLVGCTVPSLEELEKEWGGGLSLVVSYDASFRRGCIEVQTLDMASGTLEVKRFRAAGQTSPLSVPLLKKEGWGDQLELVAAAYEREDCAGPAVDTQEAQADLRRKAPVELTLRTPDVDEDGFVARRDGGGGTDCDDTQAARFPGNAEVCDELDNDCDADGAVDEGFDKEWYRDGDNDGAVEQGSRVVLCNPPDARYVRLNSQAFDCDDSDPERTPGRSELCDGKDNNCAGGVDETFPTKGANCMNDVCAGTRVCSADKLSTVCGAPAPVTWHPDADGDGAGAAGTAGTRVCPPAMGPAGTVTNETDCDDADRIARAGLGEVCDAVDNDCDGQVDEGASCGGTLTQVVDPALGDANHDWRAVALGPGGLPVWIVGRNGKIAVRTAAGGAFRSHSFGDTPANTTNCGEVNWYAAWVRPSDGHVFLAGGGAVAQHTGAACINKASAPGAILSGIIGFESGGVTTLYLVSTDGQFFTWVPGSAPVERNNTTNSYNTIHGLDRALLLVAGSSSGSDPRIVSYDGASPAGASVHALSPAGIAGQVTAVWMASSSLAYAVGQRGAVWKWDGATSWIQLPQPPAGSINFSGVVTLPNGDAYMVDSNPRGQLHRRTPLGWASRGPALPTQTPPLYGIAMSSERDFWVVGDDGFVFHYPEPPRP